MSLIPHTYLPRSMYDMDMWHRPSAFGPSTLDMFDPFDDLDREMSRNLMWLNRPTFLDQDPFARPRVPNKYRVALDCRGYNGNSIRTEIKDGRLLISGSEGQKGKENEDFSVREFHKTYVLPDNAETDKMVSFLTSNGQLVVEMPLRENEVALKSESLLPQILDDADGHKRVEMKLTLPANIDPAKINITCKDRDVIIRAQDRDDKPDHFSSVNYYQRTTLPPNTDFAALQCTFDKDHRLHIAAPMNDNALTDRNHPLPIEHHKDHKDKSSGRKGSK